MLFARTDLRRSVSLGRRLAKRLGVSAQLVIPITEKLKRMPDHRRTNELLRQTRRTVYVIGAMYLAGGLAVTAYGALTARVTEALCGFLIINLVLLGAGLLLVVCRLTEHVSSNSEQLDELGHFVRRFEESTGWLTATPEEQKAEASFDLAAFGRGDPSVLTGAVLNRSVFPRLVTTMDAASGDEDAGAGLHERAGEPSHMESAIGGEWSFSAAGPGRTNLLRKWRIALRESDVPTCRRVLSALVDTADPDLVAEFQIELERLVQRVERDLRGRFVERVRSGDREGAMDVGREMITRLPDSFIARDYLRIEPLLVHRAAGKDHGHAAVRSV